MYSDPKILKLVKQKKLYFWLMSPPRLFCLWLCPSLASVTHTVILQGPAQQTLPNSGHNIIAWKSVREWGLGEGLALAILCTVVSRPIHALGFISIHLYSTPVQHLFLWICLTQMHSKSRTHLYISLQKSQGTLTGALVSLHYMFMLGTQETDILLWGLLEDTFLHLQHHIQDSKKKKESGTGLTRKGISGEEVQSKLYGQCEKTWVSGVLPSGIIPSAVPILQRAGAEPSSRQWQSLSAACSVQAPHLP